MNTFTTEVMTEEEAQALHLMYLGLFADAEPGSEEEKYYHTKSIEARDILRAIRKTQGV